MFNFPMCFSQFSGISTFRNTDLYTHSLNSMNVILLLAVSAIMDFSSRKPKSRHQKLTGQQTTI